MPKTKYSEAAIEGLINASRAMRAGKVKEAEKHFSDADSAIGQHVEYLKSIGDHLEANHAQKTYNAQKKTMMSAHKFNVKSVGNKRTKKSEADLNEVARGIFLKAEKDSTTVKLGQSANPRYEYKGLHELHPEDRKRVLGRSGHQTMYAGKEHHKFLYPTDNSGRLVHSSRIAAPGHHDFSAAKAAMDESSGTGSKPSQFSSVDKAKATIIDIRSRLKPKSGA